MARRKSIGIRERLKGLISDRQLWRLARESEFVKRERKLKAPSFFWTVVLGFATGQKRAIAGMRRAYEGSTGVTLVPSSFYDRFTPGLVGFLKKAFAYLAEKVSEASHPLRGALCWLKDIVVADATVLRLHDLLRGAFAACRTNHTQAAAKLHVVMSALGCGAHTVKITAEREREGKKFRVGPWCRDRLLMFDLGYYRFGLFAAIHGYGGYFLSRLKKNANPLISAVHSGSGRLKEAVVGMRLQQALRLTNEPILDLEVEFSFQHRAYLGVRRSARVRFRVVAAWNEETGCYHLYVTDLPEDRILPEDIPQIYRARWQVELTFRHLKSCFRLEDLPSRKKHVVEALIYASLITLIASKDVLRAVRNKLREQRERIKEGRWSELFNSFADRILLLINGPSCCAPQLARYLEPMLLAEAVDPHRNRPGLLDQVQNETTLAGA